MLSTSALGFVDEIQAGILQSRRDQILEDLYDVEVGSLMDDERRKALKEEYNVVSHQLEGLRCSYFKDPLSFLPAEVWVPIIRDATNENEDNLTSTDKLLALTLVSKVWSELLLSTPVLWTELSIGNGETDAQAKLGIALLLSRNTLLNLVVYAPQYELDADLSQMRHHTHRIQQITIRMSKRGDYCDLKDFLRPFIPEFGPFPALRVLRGDEGSSHFDFSIISSSSPGSTHACGLKVPLEMMTRPRWAPLRPSPTDAPFGNVLEQLSELRNMEEFISVEGDICSNNPGHHTHDQVSSNLPALKTIHHRLPVDHSFFKMLEGAENLTSLGLCITEKWQHLHDLFHLMGHLPELQSLSLTFHTVQGQLALPDNIPTQTRVRDLEVVISGQEVDEATLFLVFPAYFPEVTSLTLELSVFGPSVAAYISLLSHLESLRLQVVRIAAPDAVITSASLESLRLASEFEGCVQSLASTLKCPLLSELRWDAGRRGIDNPQRHMTAPTAELLLWNGILSLKIGSISYSHSSIPKFTALRKLHLDGEKIYGKLNACSGIPGVLTSLILEPYLCPALQELGLGHIPEWDLLFIMLERRNYLPRSQGIGRIETLILPTPIPPLILRPLTEILSGRFTERPSNLALSYSGVIEQYFDPSIPGCKTCLKSMMYCSSAVNNISSMILYVWPAALASRRFPKSDDLSKWLEGREDRLLQWRSREASWDKSERSRLAVCDGMALVQRPFTVTGTSFPGEFFYSHRVTVGY